MSAGYGDKTIAAVLGVRWGRILSETLAAGYVKLTLTQFRQRPEYAALVRAYPGVPRGVDREDLDRVINEWKEKNPPKACASEGPAELNDRK